MAAVEGVGRHGGSVGDTTHDLYRRYGKQIYAYCYHRLRSREEAEDAVQTTFMNAFRSLQRGSTAEYEQAWLFKIAQNVCIARHSSSSRRLRLEAPNDLETLQEVVPAREGEEPLELIGIEEALERMPENQRRALLLREWQGLSYREISAELDVSQAAVEMLIFRARRTLAGALEEPGAERKRRVGRKVGSLGSILGALKTLCGGGAAIKAVAVAAATVAVVGESASHTIVRPSTHAKPAAAPVAQARRAAAVVPVAPARRAAATHAARAAHTRARRAAAPPRTASTPAVEAAPPPSTAAPDPVAPAVTTPEPTATTPHEQPRPTVSQDPAPSPEPPKAHDRDTETTSTPTPAPPAKERDKETWSQPSTPAPAPVPVETPTATTPTTAIAPATIDQHDRGRYKKLDVPAEPVATTPAVPPATQTTSTASTTTTPTTTTTTAAAPPPLTLTTPVVVTGPALPSVDPPGKGLAWGHTGSTP
jgi:RNA polymerase sigma-70 factor (ECF subfamily)